jgi:hypothetical protein
MRKGPGGGLVAEGEMIEVVEVSLDSAKNILAGKFLKSPPWTLYGILWFLNIKLPSLNKI